MMFGKIVDRKFDVFLGKWKLFFFLLGIVCCGVKYLLFLDVLWGIL